MDQAGLGATAGDGHLQRIDDQLRAHVLGHAPADDRAAVGVLDGSEIEPAGRNWRSTKSSATLTPGTLIVVRPRLRRTNPEIWASRINRATRLRPTRMPCVMRSWHGCAGTRKRPGDPRESRG